MSSRIEGNKITIASSFVVSSECETAKKFAASQEAVIEKTKKDAEEIIERALKKADEIVATATQEALTQTDSIKEDARSQGYNEGFQAGYNEGEAKIYQELQEKMVKMDNFTASAFDIKKRIIKSAHNDIVQLIMTISDKICHKKLELDNDMLFELTKASVAQLKEKETINLIINPSMLEKIQDVVERLKNEVHSIKNIKIIGDSSVNEDGVIVESLECRVDSCISSQIEELTNKLLTQLQMVAEDELVAEIDSSIENEND